MVMMIEMITPIAIEDEIFGPKITMMIGPSATFGIAFRTTR
ncbi:ABC transporter permease protein [Bacillus mycoides]|uniref:ABC transporter permease protein n=1 Tax=Bacillus mycoides TaxID=1405 RepID=C2Y0Q2_BACMY|nr:ABC transporter permease protein [Bacillus mycoides]